MRAMCAWCSVRSESGQHWICRGLFKLTIWSTEAGSIHVFSYSECMERYQELYGGREPSDETKASMCAHFYEQMRQVPGLQYAIQWCELSTDQIPQARERELIDGSCSKLNIMMRGEEQWAFSEHESTLNSKE
eukprot:7926122-Pyramimonas_sp.AAC.1